MTSVIDLTLSGSDLWTKLITRLPHEQQDVYFSAQHYRLNEEKGEGEARCFVYEHGADLAIYPFLLNKINDLGYNLDGDYYDVQGAYGYNGIATSTEDPLFIKQLESAWLEWAKANNIVTEFIRYNPVLKNQNLCPWAAPIDVLDNVLIPLRNYEDVWKNSYERSVRNAVRKTEKFGMSFQLEMCDEISESLYQKFTELYLETMKRRSADDYYYFDKSYFHNLRHYMKDHLLLVAAQLDGEIISIDLYLHNHINAYGFLSGTKKEFFNLSPNTFLRDRTIKALIDMGFKNYSIGGGLERNDSIFKYKKNFSIATESVFYIGKKVHLPEVFSEINAQWEAKYPNAAEKHGGKLQGYRIQV